MMKNNLQDKAYKIIKTYFGVRKTKCAYIKEYVETLYEDDDPEPFIQMQTNEDS